MTPSPCTKMKLSPSKKSTTHALLSHISNKAETVCHHVPPHVSTRATEYLVSRANCSPGVLRYFRNNIYKPWTLGLNVQHGGNGTHAPTPAAWPPPESGIYCTVHHLKGMGWDRSWEKKPKLHGERTCCLAACPQALLAHIACTIWSLKAKHGM